MHNLLFYNNIYHIIILDMFQAIPCSSLGGQIVLLQHLVLSLSVSSHSVHRLTADSALNRCTERLLTWTPLSTGALNGCLRGLRSQPVHWTAAYADSTLNRYTERLLTESDDTRCCNNTIWPPEDEHGIARNVSRIIM